LHGSQFREAALIVASPPCQGYSYRAMPWSRAKALPPPDNSLFEACFRIQREACAAAGRHIPLVVENVRGAQKWVGRARWNFGSFYFWGDVPALMPIRIGGFKSSGMNWSDQTKRGQDFTRIAGRQTMDGVKNNGGSWFAIGGPGQKVTRENPVHALVKSGDFTRIAGRQAMEGIKGVPHRTKGHWTNPAEHDDGIKQGGTWWHDPDSVSRTSSSKSSARKMASAMIAKIPLPVSRHIGAVFYPAATERAA
jgi:hypothetical protein